MEPGVPSIQTRKRAHVEFCIQLQLYVHVCAGACKHVDNLTCHVAPLSLSSHLFLSQCLLLAKHKLNSVSYRASKPHGLIHFYSLSQH